MIQWLILAFSAPGESPPPPPRAHFGRSELTEKIVGLVENLTPIALIGVGGIGKTSTALTVLHDDRIKKRFGENRRFIRCDQFQTSLPHFLHRLSTVLGVGVENPEDLTPLRPFLSSRKILIVLDNAESILDPRGSNAKEIYGVVEELAQFNNICLCITSRISIVPPAYESLDIPTLSTEAARDAFYDIYKHVERLDAIDNILEQLDFHPLSITLLATVAHHSKWGAKRLTMEWGKRRTGVLHTQHDKSLAATIELSLASPMFQELGPDARELLGVVAFFPQGVNEDNVEWLFPTLSDITNILDNFCSLSLTYRSNESVTMLAPLRDYLYPGNPQSSQLLCSIKDCYSGRLSVEIIPGEPNFEEARWIMLEDMNIKHLLDVFASADTVSNDIWDMCAHFIGHLRWHRPRLVVLGPRIEGLPDDHPSKPRCLFEFSLLLESVGNHAESKRLKCHSLKVWRERGDDLQIAQTLTSLSDTNRQLGLREEGILRAREAFEIYERLCNISGQSRSLQSLGLSLYRSNQLDAAEEALSRALDLSSSEGDQFQISQCHNLLGAICKSKDGTEAAIDHFEIALGIASRVNSRDQQFRCHCSLAELFLDEGRFDNASTHIEHCKSHAVDDAHKLSLAMALHAVVLLGQCRFEEAKSEVLCAAETFEKLGAARDLEACRMILRRIQEEGNNPVVAHEPDGDCELLETVPFLHLTIPHFIRTGPRMLKPTFRFMRPLAPHIVPSCCIIQYTSIFFFSLREHIPLLMYINSYLLCVCILSKFHQRWD